MPFSYPNFKKEIGKYLSDYFLEKKIIKILDVGPGSGTYADILPTFKMDCIEIFERYVSDYDLKTKYNQIFIGNILNLDCSGYEFLILGDILEHLSIKDSTKLLNRLEALSIKCLVAVPYQYIQDEMFGNKHEKHLQEDLTPQIIKERYPSLNLLIGDQNYGYYLNFKFILNGQ